MKKVIIISIILLFACLCGLSAQEFGFTALEHHEYDFSKLPTTVGGWFTLAGGSLLAVPAAPIIGLATFDFVVVLGVTLFTFGTVYKNGWADQNLWPWLREGWDFLFKDFYPASPWLEITIGTAATGTALLITGIILDAVSDKKLHASPVKFKNGQVVYYF
ncbi:MAG: hypothetical protein LBM77_06850 [Spirochaetaceae bacterium]|jgi:hypothetical protein|nr:hypothetical protein [Spirochaetaceae bacterium]